MNPCLFGIDTGRVGFRIGVTKVKIVRWESGSGACNGGSAKKFYYLEQNECNAMIRKTTTTFSVDSESLSRLDGVKQLQFFEIFYIVKFPD